VGDANILLDVIGIEPTVVAVEERYERRNDIVFGCADRLRDERVDAVRPDDNLGLLFRHMTVPAAPLDTGDAVTVHEQFFDREVLPQLGPAFCRCID